MTLLSEQEFEDFARRRKVILNNESRTEQPRLFGGWVD